MTCEGEPGERRTRVSESPPSRPGVHRCGLCAIQIVLAIAELFSSEDHRHTNGCEQARKGELDARLSVVDSRIMQEIAEPLAAKSLERVRCHVVDRLGAINEAEQPAIRSVCGSAIESWVPNLKRTYLEGLGANALELVSPADTWTDRSSGWDYYATTNPFAADYDLGFSERHLPPAPSTDLIRLIKSCHQHGMRFFLDIEMSASLHNPYRVLNFDEFFVQPGANDVPGWRQLRDGLGWDLFNYNFLVSGYDPVTGNSATITPARQYMKACMNHWMSYYRVDGLRLVAVENIGSWDFVEELKSYAHAVWHGRKGPRNRFMVVGEDLAVPLGLLSQNRLDALENEHFKRMVRHAIIGQPDEYEPSTSSFSSCDEDAASISRLCR